jgi:hypothetical protein
VTETGEYLKEDMGSDWWGLDFGGERGKERRRLGVHSTGGRTTK